MITVIRKLLGALLEALLGAKKPKPTPPPPAGVPKHEYFADMALIPDMMRAAGLGQNATDNQIYWYLSRLMYGDTGDQTANPEEGYRELASQREGILAWWFARINALIERMRANPLLTVTLITNDGHDRCGRSLGRGTLENIPADLLGRVVMGTTVPD